MARQFLLVRVGERHFAFPVEHVDGVLPQAPVTPVPFVPAWVEGLVMVRGAMHTQIDLLAWATGTRHDAPGYELLKIATPEGPSVVKVDRVLRLVTELGEEVQLVDPCALVPGEAEELPPPAADFSEPLHGEEGLEVTAELTVLVTVAGERFGLPVRRVREVLKLGDTTPTPLPQAPPALLGLMELRGRQIPLVSMAALLGGEACPGSRAAIVDTADGPVALVVDDILGLERLGELEDHPLLDQWNGLIGCWQGQAGGVVGLVHVDALFDEERRRELAAFLPRHQTDQAERPPEPVRRLMTFSVAGRLCAVEAPEVEQVVAWQPPGAVPDGDAELNGFVQVQGEVLPVVDLCRRLGLDAVREPPCAFLVARLAGERTAVSIGRPGRMASVPESLVHPLGGGRPGLVEAVARIGEQNAWVLHLSAMDERRTA